MYYHEAIVLSASFAPHVGGTFGGSSVACKNSNYVGKQSRPLPS